MESKGITLYHTTRDDTKASVAERGVRSTMERLQKVMVLHNTFLWEPYLQKVTKAYNDTPMKNNLFMSPTELIHDKEKEKKLMKFKAQNLIDYWNKNDRGRTVPIKKGDFVRHITEQGIFKKKYLPQFGSDIKEVAEVDDSQQPPMIRLKNSNKKYYIPEIIKTLEDPEKAKKKFIILKKRNLGRVLRSENKTNTKEEYLLRNINSGDLPSTWVDKDQLLSRKNDILNFDQFDV